MLTVARNLWIIVADGVAHKVIDAQDIDDYDISKDFDDGCEFMKYWISRGPVLVHCAAGVSRSASMVICYLMRRDRTSFSKTFSYVKSKRRVICPNDGFIDCLLKEELRLGIRSHLGNNNIKD